MTRISLAIIAIVATVGVAMATDQDRVARAPSAIDQTAGAKVSPAQAAIDQAAAAGKYVFIFFFDAQDSHTSAMNGVFRTAMAKMADRADAVAVNVANPAEKPIVDKFSVRGRPCRSSWL